MNKVKKAKGIWLTQEGFQTLWTQQQQDAFLAVGALIARFRQENSVARRSL